MTELRILQEKYYRKIKERGFKDIEYGKEHQPRLYEPVNISRIDPITSEYYDAVWDVYHLWVEEKRRRRDTLIAELHASQDGDTGTVRGIRRVLKRRGLKPFCLNSVQETIHEINIIIAEVRLKIRTLAQD